MIFSEPATQVVRYLPILGFPKRRIGDDGSIWRRSRDVWKLVQPCLRGKGYLAIRLGGKNRRVHRLVLEHFVGPCPPGMETRHLNDNRIDNRLSNLAWGTREQNAIDRREHGVILRGERHPMSKLHVNSVRIIRERIAAGEPVKTVARAFQVAPRTIRDIRSGRIWREPEAQLSAA
jgi:hypothetical protein